MTHRKTSLLLLATTLFAIQPARASQSHMNVSVEVIARTILDVDQQPATVNITREDVARGYVDVPAAIAFRIRSNAARGYKLQFEAVGAPFTGAQVSWGSTTVTVGSDSSWVTRPYQKGTSAGSMNVRFSLAPSAQPATVAWPIAVSAESL